MVGARLAVHQGMRPDERLIARITDHAGGLASEVRAATEVVLSVIGAYLTTAERDLLAQELPDPLGATVVWAVGDRAIPVEEQALAPGMRLGRAHELVASVLHVLAEELSEEVLGRLRHALPEAMADLLVASPRAPDRIITRELQMIRPRRSTLSEGQPGSEHPVADAHPDRSQPNSPAAANPHGDVKLSSSHGTTQERDHDTLAEGHPRTRH